MRSLFLFVGCMLLFQGIQASEKLQKPNIIVLITDQERYPTHWPEGWGEEHLPSTQRLLKHGLNFQHAYTSASMCSPSRAVILTSQFSPINEVARTLSDASPSPTLPSKGMLMNLASLIEKKTDYDVVWKGKWHLSYAVDGLEKWSEKDIINLEDTYGPTLWNPPDGGNADHSAYLHNKKFALSTLGGGYANNDERYVSGIDPADPQQVPGWGEPLLKYLAEIGKQEKSARKPFCLFISLINPHDVWVYPIGWDEAGYKLKDFKGMGIDLPSNYKDSLKTKPSVQLLAREKLNEIAPLTSTGESLNYINFYAYLQTLSDQLIVKVLDTLEEYDLIDDTVIFRTADHGELGLSHGMREKAYTVYEEEIHIPLIVSNPKLFPTPQSTEAFYSHIDLIPTIGEFLGIGLDELNVQGKSQYPVLVGEKELVRDSILFAYDDVYLLPADTPASHIRCIRKGKWAYAVYFSLDGSIFEYELYDLEKDPGELNNLLYGSKVKKNRSTAAQLHRELTQQIKAENALPDGVPWPAQPW